MLEQTQWYTTQPLQKVRRETMPPGNGLADVRV